MKELKTDLFEAALEDGVDAICITTNGQWTRDGKAAMGGGCAGVCAREWPETAVCLGEKLRTFRMNVPFVIGALNEDGDYMEATRQMIKDRQFKCLIISFPTMDKMGHPANLQLIKQSATILKDYVDRFELKGIMVPRPGAGIGGLKWVDVKAALEPILDDRFTIVSFENEL
jgi:hypothetical protein